MRIQRKRVSHHSEFSKGHTPPPIITMVIVQICNHFFPDSPEFTGIAWCVVVRIRPRTVDYIDLRALLKARDTGIGHGPGWKWWAIFTQLSNQTGPGEYNILIRRNHTPYVVWILNIFWRHGTAIYTRLNKNANKT